MFFFVLYQARPCQSELLLLLAFHPQSSWLFFIHGHIALYTFVFKTERRGPMVISLLFLAIWMTALVHFARGEPCKPNMQPLRSHSNGYRKQPLRPQIPTVLENKKNTLNNNKKWLWSYIMSEQKTRWSRMEHYRL